LFYNSPSLQIEESKSEVAFQRFKNREVRIKRREERNTFRRKLLPVAWAIAPIGVVALLIIGAYRLIYGEWLYQFIGLAIGLTLLPILLSFVGWLRGHANDDLEEP
jgi:ABC-type multidrug transport system fused ATPase/permease subunit